MHHRTCKGSILKRIAVVLAYVTTCLLLLSVVSPSSADSDLDRKEQHRLRQSLKRRDLLDLLEFFDARYPPKDQTERLLQQYETRRAVYQDPTRSAGERSAALEGANALLRQLIEQAPDARPQWFDWQVDLVRSIVWEQLQPHSQNILLWVGSKDDYRQALTLAAQAVEVLEHLGVALQAEEDRLDALPDKKFDRLEREGYVDRLDAIRNQARWHRMWAQYYAALASPQRTEARRKVLEDVWQTLTHETDVLESADTEYRAQATLLAGMSGRQLGYHDQVRGHFRNAIDLARQFNNMKPGNPLQWVEVLAYLELARDYRDAGLYDQSLQTVRDFESWVRQTVEQPFPFQLAAALTESGIYKHLQIAGSHLGDDSVAEIHQYDVRRPLIALARNHPESEDRVYEFLYLELKDIDDAARLDAFEKNVLAQGLLRQVADTRRTEQTGDDSLNRCIALCTEVINEDSSLARAVLPEAYYNLASAYYLKGRRSEAVDAFIQAAATDPGFQRARQAAALAVQIAAKMYEDPRPAQSRRVSDQFLKALRTLTELFPESEDARYWQFYLAQALEAQEYWHQAAEAYALVNTQHEHAVTAAYCRAKCILRLLQLTDESSPSSAAKQSEMVKGIEEAVVDVHKLTRRDQRPPAEGWDADDLTRRAKLILAELYVMPKVSRPRHALTVLESLAADPIARDRLGGQIGRLQIEANLLGGRDDQVRIIVPRYIAEHPDTAAEVLQAFVTAKRAEFRRLRSTDPARASSVVEQAVFFAQQLYGLVQADPDVGESEKDRLGVQLALCLRDAGRYDNALTLFEASDADARTSTDVELLEGMAECYYQVEKYDLALPLFHKLCTSDGLEQTEVWWQSLLRELQCRAALGDDPAGIVKVIEQKRVLFPDMGTPALQQQFDALRQQQERRISS